MIIVYSVNDFESTVDDFVFQTIEWRVKPRIEIAEGTSAKLPAITHCPPVANKSQIDLPVLYFRQIMSTAIFLVVPVNIWLPPLTTAIGDFFLSRSFKGVSSLTATYRPTPNHFGRNRRPVNGN